jgi:hypothetical protein
MMYDANFTLFSDIIPLDELKSTDLLLSCMTREPFNVNGLGKILNVTFDRGSLVSKLVILMVSVPVFCKFFSSANTEDGKKVKKNNKDIIEIIKTKDILNIIILFTSLEYFDFSI